MQFTINVNQQKALEWGLNSQQALLFAFVYEVPSWAQPLKTDGGVFYVLSKAKVVEELPILTDKVDTAYRLLKQLEEAGVVELSHTANITLVRLTAKGKEWNRKQDGSEKYPSEAGNKSEVGRKNLRARSEKSPTNQDTSNQDTNHKAKARTARPPKFDPLTCKPEGVSDESWAGFCEMRKAKRAPLTLEACNLIAKKLQGHANPSAVVDLSTENGWSGVFPGSQQVSRYETRQAGRGSSSRSPQAFDQDDTTWAEELEAS